MATASIRIEQAANPLPVGAPGVSREDLILASPVVLRNGDDSDVARWRWALLDRPPDSAATLSSESAPAVTFTPDVAGTYRIRLAINDGSTFAEIDTRLAAVRSEDGLRYPAIEESAAETNFPGQNAGAGWGAAASQIVRARPQLLSSAAQETITAGLASDSFTFGGLGLPDDASQIQATEFVAVGVPVGGPPTVNGYTFTELPGFGGLANLCVADVDLDTTACVAGDAWVHLVITKNRGVILAAILTLL